MIRGDNQFSSLRLLLPFTYRFRLNYFTPACKYEVVFQATMPQVRKRAPTIDVNKDSKNIHTMLAGFSIYGVDRPPLELSISSVAKGIPVFRITPGITDQMIASMLTLSPGPSRGPPHHLASQASTNSRLAPGNVWIGRIVHVSKLLFVRACSPASVFGASIRDWSFGRTRHRARSISVQSWAIQPRRV